MLFQEHMLMKNTVNRPPSAGRQMPASVWLRGFLGLTALMLVLVLAAVVWLDPFFHYHKPVDGFYYRLSDQRFQNDGITRHFDYDAVITGTSMAENFLTSQLDELYGVHSVKVPYPGATYREINDNLRAAFATHDQIRLVVRPLDYSHLVEDKDLLRDDMGEYPDYLYDRVLFNDVKYIYNQSVVIGHVLPMLYRRLRGVPGGIDSFDSYGMSSYTYGPEQALEGRETFRIPGRDGPGQAPEEDETGGAQQNVHLTPEELQILTGNITQNVTDLAMAHPETTFCYFFPPYSAVWFGSLLEDGTFEKHLEAERTAAQMMLSCENIRLFSFSTQAEITTNLDNYRDAGHYGPWINELLLTYMQSGRCELTGENLDAYIEEERALYSGLDYAALIPAQEMQEE